MASRLCRGGRTFTLCAPSALKEMSEISQLFTVVYMAVCNVLILLEVKVVVRKVITTMVRWIVLTGMLLLQQYQGEMPKYV